MYKIYLKQTIALLKQNKFISTISILATALAIMMVMVIVVVDHIKNADIAPESNRSSMMYIRGVNTEHKIEKWQNNNAMELQMAKELKAFLKVPKVITFTNLEMSSWDQMYVKSYAQKLGFMADCRVIDENYTKFFSYNFIEGASLAKSDIVSGIKNAVISESMAEKLFGKGSVLNKVMTIDQKDYKIVGVVQDVSKAFKHAYAEIWIPYTSIGDYVRPQYGMMMLIDDNQEEALNNEIRQYEQIWNTQNENYALNLKGVYNHRHSQHNVWNTEWFEQEKKRAVNRMIFIFAVLLIIPAINLSSISMSRVYRRMSEIGIRKAFGAKRKIILIQILYENLITSLLGGGLGSGLSIVAVYVLKSWLLESDDGASFPLDAFLSFSLLGIVVFVSFLLNLMASGVPAYLATRMQIVDSLNLKNK